MIRNFFILLPLLFFFQILNSKPLIISGYNKLNLNDLQMLTNIDLKKNNYEIYEIENIINDLYGSDLIYEINFENNNDNFLISIQENRLIDNIFFVNNIWLEDDTLSSIIVSKRNNFLSKSTISNDISLINKIYKSRGFNNVTTVVKIEKYSEDRINLIYDIYEGEQSKINLINFIGNLSFSDNYLSSQINSQSLKFYNFFKSGSNLNSDIFNFDSNKIINFYKDNGFLDVKVSYSLDTNSFGIYSLNFYIEEGNRYKVDKITYGSDIQSTPFFKSFNEKFLKKLNKNKQYYDNDLFNNYLIEINQSLLSNNIHSYYVDFEIEKKDYFLNINFYEKLQTSKIINRIDIYGNSITKEKTIRSKILIEPGDYYNEYLINNSISNLNKFSYITESNFEIEDIEDKTNLSLNIEEQKKTGNLLLAGTFDSDTNLGIMFSIDDKNFAGSGNIVDANFSLNSENLKYDLNYTQFPLSNPFLSNKYSVFNIDNDYTSSFGYKSLKQGIGYSLNFSNNSQISYGIGASYEFLNGHSAINSNQVSITDNIGNFENLILKFNINKDSTNDIFNPTNGHYNNLNLSISPNVISDDSYFKFIYSNKNYFNLKNSKNFIFINNNLGYAESLNSKLKTINSFSLGGSNFKGFDYRGIGQTVGGVYLGGNRFFTSTLGYGSSFLFDDKDNINIKLFLTSGSIGYSDYSVNKEFNLRSSAGLSLDFITAVGPISFSYATPISKETDDKQRLFSFSIGSSF